jgi:hypothetical protein
MNSMALEATPTAQGIGGPVEAVLTVEFATDPHATLIVYNFTATLDIPAGLALTENTTDNPLRRSQVDLPPTQSFLVLTVRWNLTAVALGEKTLGVTVTTQSSGGGSASANVTVREGIVVGQVKATPGHPSVHDTMSFEVGVTSGFDAETSPLEVWLYILQTSAPVKPTKAHENVVTLSNGSTVLGAGFPMRLENGTYRYDVPAQPRGTFIYWVWAKTPHSSATTAAGRLLIEDPEVTGLVSTAALATVGALGVACGVYMVWDPASRKKPYGSVHNSPDRVRLAMVVLLVGAVAFAAAVYMGALDGLWVRLGYA